jgi:hypothetical protein
MVKAPPPQPATWPVETHGSVTDSAALPPHTPPHLPTPPTTLNWPYTIQVGVSWPGSGTPLGQARMVARARCPRSTRPRARTRSRSTPRRPAPTSTAAAATLSRAEQCPTLRTSSRRCSTLLSPLPLPSSSSLSVPPRPPPPPPHHPLPSHHHSRCRIDVVLADHLSRTLVPPLPYTSP